MGKSNARKQLRRLEREIGHFKEQQTHYDQKIDDLLSRKQELLTQLDPAQVKEYVKKDEHDLKSSRQVMQKTDSDRAVSEKVEKVCECCLRVKEALEKLNRAGEELITGADLRAELNQNPSDAGESPSGQQADILEMINSPKFRQIANELLGDLLKEK